MSLEHEPPNFKYFLTKLVRRRPDPDIEITQEEHAAIKRAAEGTSTGLAIEEKFKVLLEYYAEYEVEILTMAARGSVFSEFDWGFGQGSIELVNRRLLNVLSGALLYSDHVELELVRLYGRRGVVPQTFREHQEVARKSVFAWRALERIRNFAQHETLPVTTLGLERSVDKTDPDKSFVRFSVHPSISVRELTRRRRGRNKREQDELEELAANGDELQLTSLLRFYIDAIAKLHGFVQESMANDLAHWDATLIAALTRARVVFGPVPAIAAVRGMEQSNQYDDDPDAVFVFEELIKRRKDLASVTSDVKGVSDRYVSSQAR